MFCCCYYAVIIHDVLLLLLLRVLPAGRIFLTTGPDTAEEMPIFFALFQSCTAEGTFAVTPEQRATPLLSATSG